MDQDHRWADRAEESLRQAETAASTAERLRLVLKAAEYLQCAQQAEWSGREADRYNG